ncbi:hypothetical protein GW17_00040683 [Ensete ventricosum]|nr:hypothetical protein GW17_00040683 [Ensete ventricosum]
MSQALTLSFTLLRRRRCPCAGGDAARCGRQPPYQGAATPVSDSPLRACRGQPLAGAPWVASCGRAASSRPCGLAAADRPLRVVALAGGRPLQVAGSPPTGGPWLQLAAPAGGLAVASRPLAGGLGRSRLPLAARHDQPLLLAILTANALNDSTRFNLTTRSLKPIFRTKTLALIPLLGNLSGRITYAA